MGVLGDVHTGREQGEGAPAGVECAHMAHIPSELDEGGLGGIWPSHPLATRLDRHAQSGYCDGGGLQCQWEATCLELGAELDPHVPPQLCSMLAEAMEQVDGEATMATIQS